jgi:MOSC domain-containing protein YiiM
MGSTSSFTLMPLNPASSLAKLMTAPVRPGTVVWLGARPDRRVDMQVLESADLQVGKGLKGDRYKAENGNRQVTLIESESLATIASHLGKPGVPPEVLRRNIVVTGINLLALKGRRFRIGSTVLETSGECHPCSLLEESLGTGGYNAVRGLGGITARVIVGGRIALGDLVVPIAAEEG